MVRSLGLVALVLGAWMFFANPRTPDQVRTVAWQPTVQAAVAAAEYPVLAPPSEWSWAATSARVEPQPDGSLVWRVGFYTPERAYAAVLQRGVLPEQAAGTQRDWVDEQTRGGVEGGTVVLGGRQWVRMQGDPTPDERRSLVRVDGGVTTVVTGSASWAELESLAASLRPAGE